MPHLQVQGPLAREVLRPITEGADIDTLRYFRFLTDGVTVGGVPVLAVADRLFRRARLRALLQARRRHRAVERGGRAPASRTGCKPIGLSAIETMRIESGLLFPDIDYFPHQTDPFEVRLDNVIKLDTGSDFVGREALERIASQGTARLLTTLRIDGDEVPEYGAAVTVDGAEAGIVRSPARARPSTR